VTRVLLQSPSFVRSAKRLLKRQHEAAGLLRSVLEQLQSDPFHARLQTHRLKGDLAGKWACTVAYDLRLVFAFVQHDGNEAILLHALGTHDEVD
jgi:mRNA interferase YafQ